MSLDFPGDDTDRAVDLGTIDLPANTGEMSMTGWVNNATLESDEQVLIAKGDSTSSGGKDWGMQIEESGDPFMSSLLDTGGGTETLEGGVVGSGAWLFFAFTYDGSDKRVFINAVQVATGAETGDVANTAREVMLAGVNVGGSPRRELNGSLADVRIYTRALSLPEVQTMFTLLGADNIVHGRLWNWAMREKAPGQTATVAGSIKDFGSGQFDGDPVGTPTYIEGILR